MSDPVIVGIKNHVIDDITFVEAILDTGVSRKNIMYYHADMFIKPDEIIGLTESQARQLYLEKLIQSKKR